MAVIKTRIAGKDVWVSPEFLLFAYVESTFRCRGSHNEDCELCVEERLGSDRISLAWLLVIDCLSSQWD